MNSKERQRVIRNYLKGRGLSKKQIEKLSKEMYFKSEIDEYLKKKHPFKNTEPHI